MLFIFEYWNRGKYNLQDKMMSKYSSAKKGTFYPKAPWKYKGNTAPQFKSQIEWLFMRYCDTNPAVLAWTYEPPFAVIPYFDEATKRKRHYYVDFVIWVDDGHGGTQQVWVETKSSGETVKPVVKRLTESKKEAIRTYITNQCKWAEAKKHCEKRGIRFVVITEKDLK